MKMEYTTVSPRAEVWRHILGFGIDAALVMVLSTAIGIGLFEPTGGWIRASIAPLGTLDCTSFPVDRIDVPIPPGFKVTNALHCTHYFFRSVYNWSLTLVDQTQTGWISYSRFITIATDAEGQPTSTFYVDDFWGVFLASYLLLSEWRFGTTFGKRVVGIRIQSIGGGALNFAQAAKRILVRLIPLGPLVVAAPVKAIGFSPGLIGILIFMILFGAPLIVALLNFFRTVGRGDLPWHDRWARTEAIHVMKTRNR
jgi:uncharacterized RDD family membrane protein YckC